MPFYFLITTWEILTLKRSVLILRGGKGVGSPAGSSALQCYRRQYLCNIKHIIGGEVQCFNPSHWPLPCVILQMVGGEFLICAAFGAIGFVMVTLLTQRHSGHTPHRALKNAVLRVYTDWKMTFCAFKICTSTCFILVPINIRVTIFQVLFNFTYICVKYVWNFCGKYTLHTLLTSPLKKQNIVATSKP